MIGVRSCNDVYILLSFIHVQTINIDGKEKYIIARLDPIFTHFGYKAIEKACKTSFPIKIFSYRDHPTKLTSGLVQQTVKIVVRSALTISQKTHL